MQTYLNGLMQKRRNSIAKALELRLFCIKSLISPAGLFSMVNLSKGR